MNEVPNVATIKAALVAPVQQVMERYPTSRSAIMPALDLAQQKYGTVNGDTYCAIAELLDVPEIWVFEVASFYTLFNRSEMGRYHVQVCTNVSCMLRGADDLMGFLKERLAVEVGETTGDGLFTYSAVECLGACDVAPALMVNETYHENVTCEALGGLLEAYREGGAGGTS